MSIHFFNKTPIPEEFLSDLGNNLFENCSVCDAYLLDSSIPYYIEKAFKNYAENLGKVTLFEAAVCENCMKNTYNDLSKESLKTIEEYQKGVMEVMPKNYQGDYCLKTGKKADELQEYKIAIACVNNYSLEGSKMLVSSQSMEEISDLLSKESKDILRGFRDKIINPSPEIDSLINPGKKLIWI